MSDEELPSGWTKKYSSKHNKFFYIHIESKKTQWLTPSIAALDAVRGGDWVEKYSEEYQRTYWKNTKTRRTSWAAPSHSDLSISASSCHSETEKSTESWEERYSSKHKRRYWKNKVDYRTTWDNPYANHHANVMREASLTSSSTHLSDKGWEEKYSDKHQRAYWKNTGTGVTSWTNPAVHIPDTITALDAQEDNSVSSLEGSTDDTDERPSSPSGHDNCREGEERLRDIGGIAGAGSSYNCISRREHDGGGAVCANGDDGQPPERAFGGRAVMEAINATVTKVSEQYSPFQQDLHEDLPLPTPATKDEHGSGGGQETFFASTGGDCTRKEEARVMDGLMALCGTPTRNIKSIQRQGPPGDNDVSWPLKCGSAPNSEVPIAHDMTVALQYRAAIPGELDTVREGDCGESAICDLKNTVDIVQAELANRDDISQRQVITAVAVSEYPEKINDSAYHTPSGGVSLPARESSNLLNLISSTAAEEKDESPLASLRLPSAVPAATLMTQSSGTSYEEGGRICGGDNKCGHSGRQNATSAGGNVETQQQLNPVTVTMAPSEVASEGGSPTLALTERAAAVGHDDAEKHKSNTLYLRAVGSPTCAMEKSGTDDDLTADALAQDLRHQLAAVTSALTTSEAKLRKSEKALANQVVENSQLMDSICKLEAKCHAAVHCKARLEAVSVKQMDRIGKLQGKIKKLEENCSNSVEGAVSSPPGKKMDGFNDSPHEQVLTPQQNRWSEMYRDRIVCLEVALSAANMKFEEQSKCTDKLLDKYDRLKHKYAALKRDRLQDDRDMDVLMGRIRELERVNEESIGNLESFLVHFLDNSLRSEASVGPDGVSTGEVDKRLIYHTIAQSSVLGGC